MRLHFAVTFLFLVHFNKTFFFVDISNQLKSTTSLFSGGFLLSVNKCFRLDMQSNGILVLSQVANNLVVWTSSTTSTNGTKCIMQADGNLVMGDANMLKIYWASGTTGLNGASLNLQDDGNLALIDTAGAVAWKTNTPNACSCELN